MEQTCSFLNLGFNARGPYNNPYSCNIIDAKSNENDAVTTITSSNTKSNDDVKAVYYAIGLPIKTFPSSLFSTFASLEWLVFESRDQFDILNPEDFKHAANLKIFWSINGKVTSLKGHLFDEAKNLEYIDFENGKLSSIHVLAFFGLTHLKEVSLKGNKIANLHADTFKNLGSLQVLNLLGIENCVNKNFDGANSKSHEIQIDIKKSCTYITYPDEIEQSKKSSQTLEEISKIVGDNQKAIASLIAQNKILEEELKTLKNALEAKISQH